jgi:hypothetical protein
MSEIIHLQLPLRRAFPNIYGPLEYREQVKVYKRIDELLRTSGIEDELVAEALERRPGKHTPALQGRLYHAFRCAIAIRLTGLSFRAFCAQLADSLLLRWFTYSDEIGVCRPSAKSSVNRYLKYFDENDLANAIDQFTLQAAESDPAKRLGKLNAPLDLGDVFADCTCLKVNIHFPTDWVLLIDAVRTLSKSMVLIRSHGLKHRMPSPERFLRDVNKQAMAMTASRRKKDSKKARKKVLREIKRIVRVVEAHAKRYRKLLDENWEKTDWSRAEAEQVLKRMDQVLDQLPDAVHQAHERIIGGRKVHNDEKILSLYDEDVRVMVRGKAGAEVEFGNKLYLAEQRDGVLVDWEMFQDKAPTDQQLVQKSVERIKDSLGSPEGYVSDRGFTSKANVKWLEKEKVKNGMCAKDPNELREKMKDSWYAGAQKRRGSTEARIGVFKNIFLQKVMREKSFEARRQALLWSVMAHNLWVLARKSLADEAEREVAEKKKAA